MKENFPRTIIYCNSIRDVGQIYNFLVTELSDMPKIEELIEMYHSETSEEKKKKAIENLTNDSLLRVVVATSALGMGVNVASCHNVRPTIFYFRFYGSADPNLSQNEIKIKVPNSCFIFIPPADSSSMAIQKIKKNVHKLFLQVL